MSAPDEPTPDITGLRGLAAALDAVATDLAAAGTALGRLPKPTASGYGWRGTVDAVGDLVSSWAAEIDVIRRACAEVGRAAALSADDLQAAADRAAASDGTPGSDRAGGRVPL